jgi:hypothetical protein
MNKRTKNVAPTWASSVQFHLIVWQYSSTCWNTVFGQDEYLAQTLYCSIQMSYRFAQISPSQILASIFNTNCVFDPKNFEIPVMKMYSVL